MPAWSMGTAPRGKVATTTPMTTPGPGSYHVNGLSKAVIPKWSIGREQRTSLYKTSGSPGPGAYEQKSPIGKSPKYSISGRRSASTTNVVPGPGQYQPNHGPRLKSTTFGYSMAGRRSSTSALTGSPGPGSYDIRSQETKKMGKFGKDQRKSMSLSHSEAVPGPGAYTPRNAVSLHPSSPRYTFGTKSQDGLVAAAKTGPGPGSYEHKPKIGNEGIKSTMPPRRPTSAPSYGRNAPGPGSYNTLSTISGPKYRIGTAPKCELVKELVRVPGPGAYEPKDTAASFRPASPRWGMGSGKKGSYAMTERTPGPGNYESKSKLGEGPKYGIRTKTSAIILRDGVPGPGQYNPKAEPVKGRAPIAVVGKGQRGADFTTVKSVPGPGAYMQSRELTARPAYSFGTSRKLNNKSAEAAPGPGAYRLPCTFANPPDYLIPHKSIEFTYV